MLKLMLSELSMSRGDKGHGLMIMSYYFVPCFTQLCAVPYQNGGYVYLIPSLCALLCAESKRCGIIYKISRFKIILICPEGKLSWTCRLPHSTYSVITKTTVEKKQKQ